MEPSSLLSSTTIEFQRASKAKGRASIGVVIPTYNRCEDLMLCLQHLEAQSYRDFVVVVVDDGSTDTTRDRVEQFQATAGFPLRYLVQENSGPARARNRGIAELEAPLCVMIGDDIFVGPEFLERHVAFHLEHPAMGAAAVGLTRWRESGQVVTPFMRWLDEGGTQFAYGDLLAGTPASWKHFYTSNLSLKTEYLKRHPFCEAFRRAAMEDIELGYRLAREQDLQMEFLAEAVAEHQHPTTFRQACRRMLHVGEAAHQLGEIWPEFRRPEQKGFIKGVVLPLLTKAHVLGWLEKLAEAMNRLWCPNPLMRIVLLLYQRAGYERAEASGVGEGRRQSVHTR